MKKYKLLDYAQVDRIIEILLNANLDKSVKINSLGLKTEFNNLSEIYDHKSGDFRCIQNGSDNIYLKNSGGNYFAISVGDWRRKVVNPKCHIIFHSNLITDRFDIEGGFCLQDDKFIYFAKRTYTQKGRGAMESYATEFNKKYNHRYPEIFDKNSPFDTLLDVIGSDRNLEDGWISLSKIEKSKFFDKKFENEILHTFLSDITNILFSIENILIGKKDDLIEEVIAQKSLRQILSLEDKKRIELAAMEYVKNKWEDDDFNMIDVSANRGEEWGYDFEANEKYYIEVKGTTIQGDWNIIMTKNEYNASEKHKKKYFLCIVQFDNKEDLNVVNYEEIQYPSRGENLQIEPYTYTVKKK